MYGFMNRLKVTCLNLSIIGTDGSWLGKRMETFSIIQIGVRVFIYLSLWDLFFYYSGMVRSLDLGRVESRARIPV